MVQIHLSYGESTSMDMVLGFELASELWSAVLTDDVDIYFHVEGSSDLPSHIVGGALPAVEADKDYEKIREGLLENATSAIDQVAVEHLNQHKEFSIAANGDQDLEKTKKMQLTRANAKALGLEKSNNTKLDGYILISDLAQQGEYTWDFSWDRQAEFASGNLDFIAVALHEIGHLLGFVSGVDSSEWLETVIERQDKADAYLAKMEDKTVYFKEDAMKYANPLDLFRFSDKTSAAGKQDLSIGHEAYFSVDGGKTALASFSTGKADGFGGDGYQASHWQQSDEPVGIMDPLLIAEQRRAITEIDLTALDAIGWEINSDGLEIDLNHTLTAVESSLAERTGLSIEALYDSPDSVLERLTRDRTKDVHKMLKDSDVYEWGRRRWSRSSGRWQEIVQLMQEQGSFQTIQELQQTFPAEASTTNDALLEGAVTQPFLQVTPNRVYSVNQTAAQSFMMTAGAVPDTSLPSASNFQPIQPSGDNGTPSTTFPLVQASDPSYLGRGNDTQPPPPSGLLDPLLDAALAVHPLMLQGESLLHG